MTQITPIRDLKAYLAPEQVDRLIALATNPRDVLLVRIPWRTGIRVTELISIRIQDIDFDNRAIVIKVQKIRKKDGKALERRRVVPRPVDIYLLNLSVVSDDHRTIIELEAVYRDCKGYAIRERVHLRRLPCGTFSN